jgi:predicted transcriptional regulator
MARRKKNPKGEILSVRVSAATKTELEKIADSQDRSLSWLVAKILGDYLASRSKKDRATSREGRSR